MASSTRRTIAQIATNQPHLRASEPDANLDSGDGALCIGPKGDECIEEGTEIADGVDLQRGARCRAADCNTEIVLTERFEQRATGR